MSTTGVATVTAGVSLNSRLLDGAAMRHDAAARAKVGDQKPRPQPGEQPRQQRPNGLQEPVSTGLGCARVCRAGSH
jgi:hypothetical protein